MDVRTVLTLFVAVSLCDGDGRPLYLLDLYDCIDDYEDYCHNIPEFSIQAAIELANNRTDILPGYTLYTPLNYASVPVGSVRSGEVLVSVATLRNLNFDIIYARSQNAFISPIIIGSPFSFVNEYAAYILGNETMLNLSQVTYESRLVTLDRFPYFYRVGPNSNIFNSVRHQLLQNNKWRRVGLLSSAGIHSMAAECLEEELKGDCTFQESCIEVINTASFILNGRESEDVWQLTELKKEDIRIIIGFFSVLDVPTIMCESYHMGLVDEHHVWILPEMNLNDIWKVAINNNYSNCSVDVLKMSLNNALMVGADYENGTDQNINVNVGELDQLLLQYYRDVNPNMSTTELSNIPGYHLSRVIFDVTWAVILALNYSNSEEKLDNFLMKNGTHVPIVNETFAKLLSESLSQIRFNGSSGPVDLKKGHSTSFSVHVSQIINDSACPVEIYTVLRNDNINCSSTSTVMLRSANVRDYVWGDNPPLSGGLIKYQGVPTALLYFTIVATVLFLSFALVLLVSNTALKRKKYFKTANPIISALIIFSAVLIFISTIPRVVAFGAVQYNVSRSQFAALCQAELMLSEFGMVLMYALFLVKTWRLYHIITNKLLRRKIRFVSNQAVFTMLPLLVAPVVVLLIIQCFVDKAEWKYEEVEYQGGHPYKSIRYTLCNSYSRVWEILAAIYKL
ncbi:gamma-aminobutyric acid type B receptor subunit 2-like isoform X2 [Dysidea avara]|uniref:gamma-aminobutyric acid type B receptor subunit 2-like isoform X2 n=1 Tax=Dysidea avara TaxID=196820 RepID=UPI003318FA41